MTFKQAAEIRDKYAHLIGAPFGTYIIRDIVEHIAIAPFKTSMQWFFAEVFRLCHSVDKALSYYHGTEFDVILMTQHSSRECEVFIQDIHSYLRERRDNHQEVLTVKL